MPPAILDIVTKKVSSTPDRKTLCRNKLYGLRVLDFGCATGRTCVFKTPWCAAGCYARPNNPSRNFNARNEQGRRVLVRCGRLEQAPARDFYDALIKLPQGVGLRIARYGDAGNPERVEAVISALLRRPDIRFMWPTRAWRAPRHPSWQLIERYLPRRLLLSTDPYTERHRERPPAGWATAGIRMPPDYKAPHGTMTCPHYLTHGCVNCVQCWACFTTSDGRLRGPRPIAFNLHATGGRHQAACMRADCHDCRRYRPAERRAAAGLGWPGDDDGVWCAEGDDV